jgi:hypothetical protein
MLGSCEFITHRKANNEIMYTKFNFESMDTIKCSYALGLLQGAQDFYKNKNSTWKNKEMSLPNIIPKITSI